MPPSTSSSKGDKKSNGMKPITLPSVAKYLLNVGKSVSNVAVDYFGEIAPTSQEFLETNEDLFKEVVSSVVDYKQTLKKATATLKKSKIWEAYTEGKKALFEDLRTGNFYNKQREDSLNAKAIGMDLDFGDDDMEFDDSMFSFDDDDTSDTAKQTRVLDMSIEAAAKANASITAQSGALVAETVKDSTQIMFVQNREMMNKVQAGMTGMANILTDMNKFMNGPLVTGLQNAKTYQEKSLQHLGNLEGMMNELLTMQRNLYAAKQDEYKEEGYNSVFDSDGIPDLKEYGNQIKKNIKSFLGPEFDMLFGNAFGKDSNGLLMMVASPLKFIPEFFVKKIIPETVKKSIEVFDQSLSGLFSTMISHIANMGEGEGALDPRSILARILGVDIKIKNSVDTTKFKKGPVPFDGETRQTILKVIPGYLARIESALTGGLERMYDMSTGKWTSVGKVAEDYKKRKENAYKDSWGEAAEPVKQYITSLKNAKNKDGSDNKKSTERAKELEEAFDKILKKVYNEDKGEFLGYRQKRDTDGDYVTPYEYYEVEENLYKIIMDILSDKKNRKNMTHIARNVMSERESWNDYLKMAEEKNSALMSLFDKSYAINADDLTLKNGTGVGYKGGPQNFLAQAVDEHGNNVFFYLREMLGNLMNIADGAGGTGGGKGKRRRGATKSASKRVEELIKARNEAQAKKDDKQSKGQDTQAEEKTLDEINEEIEKARIEAEKELDENGVPMKDRDLDDSEKAFIGKLKDATTFGEKFQAVQNAIDKAMKKPTMILTSMLDTADRKLYELLFGKEELMNLDKDDRHRGPQGVIDMILIKMEESFDNFNDWLKETVMDPVKAWMDEIGLTKFLNGVKDKAKDAWDWTKDKLHVSDIHDALKRKLGWGKDQVVNAFNETGMDIYDSAAAAQDSSGALDIIAGVMNRDLGKFVNYQRRVKNEVQRTDKLENIRRMMPDRFDARTGQIINVSDDDTKFTSGAEGTAPGSKSNKFRTTFESDKAAYQKLRAAGFPNALAQQLAYEYQRRLDAKFESALSKTDDPDTIDIEALEKETILELAKENKIEVKLLAQGSRFITQRGLAVVSPGETILPATYDKAKQKTQLAHEKAYARRFGIKGASYYAEGKEGEDSDTGVAQTVNPEKDQKAVWDTIKAIGKEMNGSDSVVDTVADMLIGGGVSLITGMIGGPLLGAAVGAGVSLTKNSVTFREMLFGKDLEDGSHEGGVIPKSWQDIASKYLPDVKKYGIVGGVAGLLTPFGLVGGIAAGSAIAMAKNNEDVQEFLFGKMQEDEEGNKFRDGGLISKAFRDQVKKAVPNMLIGAAGMAIAGPFGIFPNAVMGSALGLLTSTDKFKNALLGTKDENGKRRGGVLGALKTGFVNPLLEWGKNLMEETKKWLKETVWDNTKRFLKPFTKMLSNAVGSIVGVIGNFFNEKITMPIYDVVLHKFLEPAGKVAGKLVRAPIALAKTIFGAPFKMLGAVGDNIRMSQISKGTADDMTAAERVDFRKKHEGRHLFKALTGNRDKFGHIDRMLLSDKYEGKEGIERMEKMRNDIDMLSSTRSKLNDKFTKLCNECIQKISDILNSDVMEDNGHVMSCYTYVKFKNVKTLSNLIKKAQMDEAIKEVTNKMSRWADLPSDVITKIVECIEAYADPINKAFIDNKDAKGYAKRLSKEIGKFTGLNKMKDLNRLKKNLDREIKVRKKDQEEEDDKSEEQKLREELQDRQWNITKTYLDIHNERLYSFLDTIESYIADMAGYDPDTGKKKEEAEADEVQAEAERVDYEGRLIVADGAKDEFNYEENMKAKRREIAKTLAGTMNQMGNQMDRDNIMNFFSGEIFKDKDMIEKLKNTRPEDFYNEIASSPEFNMALRDIFEGSTAGQRKKLKRQMGNYITRYSDDIAKYFEDINVEADQVENEVTPIPEDEEDEYGPADGYRGWRKLGKKLQKKLGYKSYDPENLQGEASSVKRIGVLGKLGKAKRAIGRGKDGLLHQIGSVGRGLKEGVIEGFKAGNSDEKLKDTTTKFGTIAYTGADRVGNAIGGVEKRVWDAYSGKGEIFGESKPKEEEEGATSIGGIIQGNASDVKKLADEGYVAKTDKDGHTAYFDSDGEMVDTPGSKDYEEARNEEEETAKRNSTALEDIAKGTVGMVSGFFGKAWNTGKKAVGGILGSIGNFIDNFGGPVFKVIKLIFGGVTLAAVTGHLADFWTNTLGPAIGPFFKTVGEKVMEVGGNLLSGFKTFIDEHWPKLGETIDKVTTTIKTFIDNPIGFIKDFYVEGLQKFGDYIIEPLGQMIWNVLHSQSLEELTAKNKELVTNKYQKTDSSGNKLYVDAEGKETTEEFDANGNRNIEVELSTTASHYEHNQNLGNRIMSGGLFSGKMITDTYTDTHNGHKYILEKYSTGLIVIKNNNTGSFLKFTLGGNQLEMGWKVDKDGKCADPQFEAVVTNCGLGALIGGVAGAAVGAGVTLAAGAGAFGSTVAGTALSSAAAGSVVPGIGTVIGVATGVVAGIGVYIYQKNSGSMVEAKLDLTKSDEELSASMLLLAFGWVGGIGEFRQWPQWQVEYDNAAKGSTTYDDDSRFDSTLTYNENRAGNVNANAVTNNAITDLTKNAPSMSVYTYAGGKRESGKGPGEDDHIYQNGLELANQKLGDSTIGDSGCGPVTVTNLINRMGGNMDVDTAARAAESGGYIDSTGGTTTNYISDMLNRAGMSAKETMDKTSVFESLKQGNPAVLLGNSGKEQGTPFGAGDHYINAMGMDDSGNIYAEDPDLPQSMVKYKASDVMHDMDVGIMTGAGRAGRDRVPQYRMNKPRGAVYGQRLTSSIRRQGFKSIGRKRSGRAAVANTAPDGGGGSIEGVNNKIWVPAWVIKAVGIIIGNEGGYDSINKNDNGGMSVGKCQWHAGRAGDILYKIFTSLMQSKVMTEQQIIDKIGESLFTAVMNPTTFGKRNCYDSEYSGLKEILGTDISKNIQDAQGFHDIEGYYTDYISKYLNVATQENEVIYTCDFFNQYGTCKDLMDAAKSAAGGDYKNITLDILHKACLAKYSKYHSRREKVYTTLLGSELVGANTVEVNAADLGPFTEAAGYEAQYAYESAGGADGSTGRTAIEQITEVLNAVFRGVLQTAGYDPNLFDTLFGSSSSSGTFEGDGSGGTTYRSGGKVNSAQLALPAWLATKEKQVRYSQTAAQDPDQGTGSCASTTWWAYRKALNLTGTNSSSYQWEKNDDRFGTIYTSPRYMNRSSTGGYGDLSNLQPGDVLFYERSSANASGNTHHIGHTAMYAGDGMIWNHGGNPTYGPVLKEIDRDAKTLVAVKRYLPFINGEKPPFTNPDGTPGEYPPEQVADLAAFNNGEGPKALDVDEDGNPISPIALNSGFNSSIIKDPFGASNPLANKINNVSLGASLPTTTTTTTTPAATTTTEKKKKYVGMLMVNGKSYAYDSTKSPYTLEFAQQHSTLPLVEVDEDYEFPQPSTTTPSLPAGISSPYLQGGSNRKKKVNVMEGRNRFMSGLSRIRKETRGSVARNIEKKYEGGIGSNLSDDTTGVTSEDYAAHLMTGKARSSASSISSSSTKSITQDQFLQTIIALLRIIVKNSEKTDRIVELLGSIDIHVSKSDVATINTSTDARSNIDKAIKAARARRSGRGGNPNKPNGTKPGDFGGAQNRDKNDLEYVIQTLQEFAKA